jgi:predicted SnoaL-like aldol condensation-catalyzing enzyme
MTAPLAPSASEQNKHLLMRWFQEVWNQGRRETIHELFAPHAVLHDAEGTMRGPDEFCRFFDGLRSEFSEFRIQPIVALAEGDLACVHWTAAFRHTASGKQLQHTGTSIVRVKDGQFIEAWQNWDTAGLVAELSGKPRPSFF